jgi:hypothetical protein
MRVGETILPTRNIFQVWFVAGLDADRAGGLSELWFCAVARRMASDFVGTGGLYGLRPQVHAPWAAHRIADAAVTARIFLEALDLEEACSAAGRPSQK